MSAGAPRARAARLARWALPLLAAGLPALRALPGTAELAWIGAAATSVFPAGGVPPVPPLAPLLFAPPLHLPGGDAGLVLARGVAVLLAAAVLRAAAGLAGARAGEGAEWGVLLAALALAALPGAPFPAALVSLTPAAAAALLALALVLALDTARRRELPDGFLALAGAAGGFLVLAAGISWFLAAVAGASWAGRRAARGAWEGLSARRAAALVLVPAVFVLLPVTLWNVFGARDPVVVCREGALGAFLASEPGLGPAPGTWPREALEVRFDPVPGLLGRDRAADHRRFFAGRLLRGWLAASGKRALHALRAAAQLARPVPLDDAGAGEAPPPGPVRVASGLLLGLLAAGAVLGLRRGDPAVTVGLALLAVAVLGAPPGEAGRAPLLALLLPLGVAGWHRAVRGGGRPPLAALLAAAVAGGAVLAAARAPAPPGLPSELRRGLGLLAARVPGDAARPLVLAGLASAGNDPRAAWYGARAAERVGAWPEAAAAWERLAARAELHPAWRQEARLRLFRCRAFLGEGERALAACDAFLAAAGAPEGTDVGVPLEGVPPVTACLARLERAELLAALGRRPEALADLSRVSADCGAVEGLAHRARELTTFLAVSPGE